MFDDAGSTIMSILYGVIDPSSQLRRVHLERFASQYTEPLVDYLCKVRGQSEEFAHDVVQNFWMKKLIEPENSENLVSKYLILQKSLQPGSKLSFRAYLSTSIKRFLIDSLRSKKDLASLDEMEGLDPISAENERGFDGIWANQILRRTIIGVQDECAANQQAGMWQLLLRQVIMPNLYGLKAPGYAELSQQLGYTDSKQASNAVRTVLRKFQSHLKRCIEDYLPVEENGDRSTAIQIEAEEILRLLADPNTLDHKLFEEIVQPFVSPNASSTTLENAFSSSGVSAKFLLPPEESLYSSTKDIQYRWEQIMETEVEDWLASFDEQGTYKKPVRFVDLSRSQKLPLDLLTQIRNVAKRASKQNDDEPVEILSTIYHLAIASAFINHHEILSSDPLAKVRNRVLLLLKADWLDGNSRSLLSEFVVQVSEKSKLE